MIPLPCGCVWRGTKLERGCPRSEQIREAMDILRRNGQVRSRDWYDLAIELERDHTREVG